jgi:lipopolysaccharide/colanic/teichoic acid biosynthesis glycosyltransferase
MAGDTSIAQRTENDVFYLENWSFLLDPKLIFLTMFNRKTLEKAI